MTVGFEEIPAETIPEEMPTEEEVTPTEESVSAPAPLFLAEVDEVDTTAVLALLAVIPTNSGAGLRVFERRDGEWQEVPEYVQDFKSIDPPTVVELDRDTVIAVIEQLDASDAAK